MDEKGPTGPWGTRTNHEIWRGSQGDEIASRVHDMQDRLQGQLVRGAMEDDAIGLHLRCFLSGSQARCLALSRSAALRPAAKDRVPAHSRPRL